MASRQEVVLVCDVCGIEGDPDVETRRIGVEGIEVEAEICGKDWAELLAVFAVFARAGRQVPARTKLRNVKAMPGTAWRFTSHALIRCGERNLDPAEIVSVIEDPSVTRPGRASDQEIRERNGVKAVVVPERGVVVTVARKGEDATDAYVDGQVS
jgi:hypothetical protein